MSQKVAHCLRCGVRCRRTAGNPEARLLRHTTDDGYCINCAVTEFLQDLDVVKFAGGFDQATGGGKKPFNPECFRHAHVQAQFAAIMAAGMADADPDEIDWLEVIANWNLPFPNGRKSRRRRKDQ